MSAWSIGAGTGVVKLQTVAATPAATYGQRDSLTDQPSVEDPPTVDTLIAWIPGEVIAFYAALVLLLQPEDGDTPVAKVTSGWWLVIAIAAAGLLTFLGGFSKSDDLTSKQWGELAARVVLAAFAFTIWSLVVPGAWWYSIDEISSNSTLVPLLAGLGGAAFGLLAQGIVRRLD
jgi:hypothetical protein